MPAIQPPNAENHESARRQQSGLGVGDMPKRDQRWHDEGVDLHVERVERPAAEAGPKTAPLGGVQLAIPVDHARA